MSDYLKAYSARLKRNQEALIKLANEVIKEDPEIECYWHYNNERYRNSITFFKGELINSICFHEVPYRWSGCGYSEFNGSHYGINNNCDMPFTKEDVLGTFKPVTEKKQFQSNQFFKSKEHYLKWYSFLTKMEVCNVKEI